MIKSILLSSLGLNLGLLLGRLSGFVREALVASTYGVSGEADVVVLMLTVPDLLVNMLMGGAMGAMLIPAFNQSEANARQLLYQSMASFLVLFSLLTGLLVVNSELLVGALAPGFGSGQLATAAESLGWVLWLVPLTVLSGALTAYLNASNRFLLPALGTLIINCSIIVGLALNYFGHGGLRLLAMFVLVGGVLRLASQLSQVPIDWRPLKALRPWLIERDMVIRYGQAMLSGGLLWLFPVVVRALASLQGEGNIALLNYAIRLVEFPLVIGVTFLATILFPRLSRSLGSDEPLHLNLIRYGIQATIVLSFFAAITLIVLRWEYTEFVFGRGKMTIDNIESVAELAAIGLLSLPLQGISAFLTSVYNARLDTRTPLMLNVLGLLFLLIASYSNIFGDGLPGLMWSLVATYGVISAFMIYLLRIPEFSCVRVFLEPRFLSGLLVLGVVLYGACVFLVKIGMSTWITLLTGALVAALCLSIVALLNRSIRSGLLRLVHDD